MLMIAIFVIGYIAIALEHPFKIDKAASALITGVLVWAFFVFSGADHHFIEEELLHHLSEISSIFLGSPPDPTTTILTIFQSILTDSSSEQFQ